MRIELVHAGCKGLLFAWIALFIAGASGAPTSSTAHAAPLSQSAPCNATYDALPLDNPTVISTCTEAALRAALANGGAIRFDCGPDPVTIQISAPLVTSATRDIILDGGGLITLDGGGTTRILEKPFTPGSDTDKTLGNDLVIQRMRIINGLAPAATRPRDGNARGGAINVNSSPGTRLWIFNSIFENNRTTSITDEDNQGGAIFAANIYETVIANSTFINNVAGSGGAFGAIASGLIVDRSTFLGNQAADGSAGGIVRGHGGAIHLDGVSNSFNPTTSNTVQICNSAFDGNTAVRGGGALKVTISDNLGTKATYANSLFRNNRLVGVPPTEGSGGAIYHIEDDFAGGTGEDNLEISGSTFQGNYAYRQGGAVWLLVRGRGQVINSTFAANEASERNSNRVGQGGGLLISRGVIDVIHSTFANNFATFQGGALFAGGDGDAERVVTLRGSIFYENRLDPTHSDPVTSEFQGYHTNRPLESGGLNLQFPRSKLPDFNNEANNLITKVSDQILFSDPLLAPIGENGGRTPTIALQVGSPALDVASAASCPSSDQRAVARPQGSGCDLGAFELVRALQATPLRFAAGSGDQLIRVSGDGFDLSSRVRWNGSELATTLINATQLEAIVRAELVAQPGSAQIDVSNSGLAALTAEIIAFDEQLYLPLIVE